MTLEHGSKNCWYALAAPNISLLLAEKICTGYENEVLAWGICSCCRLGVSCLWAVVWGKVAGMLCRRLPGTLGNLSDGWRRKFSSYCLSVAGRADAGGVYNCFLQRLMFGNGYNLHVEGEQGVTHQKQTKKNLTDYTITFYANSAFPYGCSWLHSLT